MKENTLFTHRSVPEITPIRERAIKEAYLLVYAFAGAAKEDHFIFTSSGAEAVNHAIWAAYLDITRKTGKNHYLCSALDEAPAVLSMSRLHELGCVFQMIPPNREGIITPKNFAEMVTPRTAMLSLSWANGLTGVIQPIEEIAALCKERGILFHIEATHALCKGDFSFHNCGADILTFSTPAGCGGVFIRTGMEISPFILGGNEQGGRRGGPFNYSSLIDLAQWAKEERGNEDHYTIEIARLRAVFEEAICEQIPDAEIFLSDQNRVPHLSTVIFPGVMSESLLFLLAQRGVAASNGGGHFQKIDHLIKACGIEDERSHCAISFEFSPSTTEEEIHSAVDKIQESVARLRLCSGYLNVRNELCPTKS